MADVEYLYDKPYADPNRVRVAGPFTVESLSPHRIVPADDERTDRRCRCRRRQGKRGPAVDTETDFAAMVIDHLKTAGVHQAERHDRIELHQPHPVAGRATSAPKAASWKARPSAAPRSSSGRSSAPSAASELTAAAREAAESRFDVLIACGFAFDAHASELTSSARCRSSRPR